ncbi:MAG TPA: hypothetical protein VKE98_10870 [Gemmataceae bacterium]|nr:hypothetical protein [Gemmataceae bacterium]
MMNRMFRLTAALSFLVLASLPQLTGGQNLNAQEQRFKFDIDPKTPLKDLLPIPPKPTPNLTPLLVKNLTKVPELHFQEFSSSQGLSLTAQEKKQNADAMAQQVAKINFVNLGKQDQFMKLLLENRRDLGGLPAVMGQSCRLNEDDSRHFQKAALEVRSFFEREILVPEPEKAKKLKNMIDTNRYENWAIIAAMMQILAPDLNQMGVGLVEALAMIKEREAIDALTRLALFAEEKTVRTSALKTLQLNSKESSDLFDQVAIPLLLNGLKYPWPAVANNAAEAILQLKRKDLIPDLISVLDEPDPRAPVINELQGKKVPVVRELVRINHHRNCLLCHPPLGSSKGAFTAPIPIPGSPFPSTSQYGGGSSDILVRADVTYLRQDFSRLQEVPNADPWPKMQRFDFLVRTRILTEAKAYQAEFAKQKTSPYRQAALTALRALTGRDAEPTAAAWRAVLALPEP